MGDMLEFLGRIRKFPACLSSAIREMYATYATPLDDRPPDGVVEVAGVVGVRGEAIGGLAEYRRFEALSGVDPRRRTARARAVPPLLGRVALASLFVGRDGVGWSDAELVAARRELVRAGEWVEREAMRRDARVNIELLDVAFVGDDPASEVVSLAFDAGGDDPLHEELAEVHALASASRAAAAIGFGDVGDLIARVAPRVEADVVVWLLHLRRAGQSKAILPGDYGIPGASVAVCHAREAAFSEPLGGVPPYVDPVTVVHELLHLFGAIDKYNQPLGSFPRGTVSFRDVMRLDVESLSRLRVDDLTASEIGWPAVAVTAPGLTPGSR